MTIHDPNREAIERMVEAERKLAYLRDRLEHLARSYDAESRTPGLSDEISMRLWRVAGQLRRLLEEDR